MTTVVRFPRVAEALPHGWRTPELQQFIAVSACSIADGDASGWEIGATEQGDPQIYLIGPAPAYECILCISRVGRIYVIEDGRGQVLLEHDRPMLLAEQAIAALRRRKATVMTQIAFAWCALREMVEEKTDALTEESMEILVAVAPHLRTLCSIVT
ncbi:MAG: hypothetical protein J0H89_15295 [Rhizobiales bacterium]|jgi:hypothetical protein|nr:hypothetical protein [Hyphomicrobiales bacterium]